jgi:hypothetical protein
MSAWTNFYSMWGSYIWCTTSVCDGKNFVIASDEVDKRRLDVESRCWGFFVWDVESGDGIR